MAQTQPDRRLCPTRQDGGASLIVQTIQGEGCQTRQRGHYHKCNICVHRNESRFAEVRPWKPLARSSASESRGPGSGPLLRP